MKLLWSYLKRYKKILFGTLALAVVNQVFSLLDPQIFRLLVDNYISRARELSRGDFLHGVLLLLLGTVFVVAYALYVNWMVGLVYFLIIPVLGGTTYLISREIKAAQVRIITETAALAGSTTETLRNVE